MLYMYVVHVRRLRTARAPVNFAKQKHFLLNRDKAVQKLTQVKFFSDLQFFFFFFVAVNVQGSGSNRRFTNW